MTRLEKIEFIEIPNVRINSFGWSAEVYPDDIDFDDE